MILDWLARVLRAAGLDVYEMPGWETRTTRASGLATVHGVVVHHTATGPNWQDGHVAALLRDGRRDLAGPLAPLGVERDGTWVVVAAGRCNHNGYGRWGNDSIGVEAYNDGRGEAWAAVQLDSLERGVAAICAHLNLDPATQVLGHRETDPQRKIDPAGIDMGAFRTRVATLINKGDDVPATLWKAEGDSKVWCVGADFQSKTHVPNPDVLAVYQYLLGTTTILEAKDARGKAWLKGIPEPLTAEAIAKAVEEKLGGSGSGSGTGPSAAEIAKAVADVLAGRLDA